MTDTDSEAAARLTAAARSRGSPVALEVALSDISAEVTADAIERRRREAAAKSPVAPRRTE